MENETPEGTQEVSAEDRAANLFSQDVEQSDAQEAAPQESETAPETFELDVEGEKFVLPKKLEKGFMQEKDYTQKSQSLAEMRKDVERQFAQIKLAQAERHFDESVKAEREQLAMVNAVLEEYGKLKWNEMSTDDLVRKKLEWDQYKEMRDGINTQIQLKRVQFDQATSQELDKLKKESRETLTKRLNWSDETEAEVRSYVKDLGITDAEYDGVFDPRHKQILWEASQYRKLKANAKPAVQQVKSVKANPSNPMTQQTKDRLAFNKALQQAGNNPIAKKSVAEAEIARRFSRGF